VRAASPAAAASLAASAATTTASAIIDDDDAAMIAALAAAEAACVWKRRRLRCRRNSCHCCADGADGVDERRATGACGGRCRGRRARRERGVRR
jgi:hypothetical protein